MAYSVVNPIRVVGGKNPIPREYGRVIIRPDFELRYGLDIFSDTYLQWYWGIWVGERPVWRNGARRYYDYFDEVKQVTEEFILELALESTGKWLCGMGNNYKRMKRKLKNQREKNATRTIQV